MVRKNSDRDDKIDFSKLGVLHRAVKKDTSASHQLIIVVKSLKRLTP